MTTVRRFRAARDVRLVALLFLLAWLGQGCQLVQNEFFSY